MKTPLRYFFPVLLLILVLLAGLHTAIAWSRYSSLDGTSGVWAALANDFSKGVFYRPIHGELGYGGTRYFPLYFMIHGLLVRSGADLVISGFVLSFITVILCNIALYHLLRRQGVPLTPSLVGSLLLFTSTSTLLALATIRADGLALALTLLGMAILNEREGRAGNMLLSSIFFSLALATKITAISGMVACLAALIINRRFKAACHFFLFVTFGYLAVASLMYLGSDGRIVEIFRACSSAGASLADIVKSPMRFLIVLSYNDIGVLVPLFLGITSLLYLPNEPGYWKTKLYFIFTLLITILVFGSPGTNYNQFIDLHASGLVLFLLLMVFLGKPYERLFRCMVASMIAIASIGTLVYIRYMDMVSYRQEYREIVQIINEDTRGKDVRILSENPLIPILARKDPYVLDAFMFRLINKGDPRIGAHLFDRLRKRGFDYVILFSADPRTKRGRDRLENDVFGDGFLTELESQYVLYKELGSQLVFVPKPVTNGMGYR